MRRTLSVLLGLLVTAGCSRKLRTWVKPGSTAEHLVVGVSGSSYRDAPLPLLNCTVFNFNCDRPSFAERAVWNVSLTQGSDSIRRIPLPVSEITYGVPPGPQYESTTAEPLRTGCYDIAVHGTVGRYGGLHFRIMPDGRIAAVSHSYSIRVRQPDRSLARRLRSADAEPRALKRS